MDSRSQHNAPVDQVHDFSQRILNTLTIGIMYLDADKIYRFCNQAAAKYLQRSPEQVIGHSLGELLPDHPEVHQMVQQVLETGTAHVMPIIPASVAGGEGNHQIRYFMVSYLPDKDEDGKVIGVFIEGRDVTDLVEDRQKKEEADGSFLKPNERSAAQCKQQSREVYQFEAILNATDTYLALMDLNFNFLFVNSAYAAGSGYTREELIGKNHFVLFPNEDNQLIFRRVVQTGEPFFITEKPFEYVNQPWKGVTWWNWSLVPVKDESGQLYAILLTLTDVTELRNTRDKGERLLAELEATIQAIAAGLIVFDTERNVRRVNRAAEELIGAPPEELTAFLIYSYPK